MNSKFTEQLNRIVKERKKLADINRIVRGLGCVVVFCVVYALILPAITKERQAYCGHTEHTHTEECFAVQRVCGFEDGDTTEILPAHTHTDDCYETFTEEITELGCATEENPDEEGGHVHTNECYVVHTVTEQRLVCGIEESSETDVTVPDAEQAHVHTSDCYREVAVCGMVEHTHTDECFENPADTARSPEWARKLPTDLTGKWSYDLVEIAKSQLGYRESQSDYELSADGVMKGYTIYGDDYGLPYADWCAMFITYCLKAAQIPSMAETEGAVYMPQGSNCKLWIDDLETAGLFHKYNEEYRPKLGDLLFLTFGGEETDHVGIIVELITDEDGVLTGIKTIEGNCDDCVMYNNYTADDGRIVGFGELPENPDYVEQTEETPVIHGEAYAISNETGEIVETTPLVVPYVAPVREEEPVEDEKEIEPTAYAPLDAEQPLAFSAMVLTADNGFNLLKTARGDVTTHTNLMLGVTPENGGSVSNKQLQYSMPDENPVVWKDIKSGSTTEIPANAIFRITIQYVGVDPQAVIDNGNQLLYVTDNILSGLRASGDISIGGENRGVITGGKITDGTETKNAIVLEFDQAWLQQLAHNNSSIAGEFYFQGQLDLSQIDQGQGDNITLADISFPIQNKGDVMAQFAEVTIEKNAKNEIITENGKNYLEYEIVVEAGKYGSPDVKVIDTISANKAFTLGYDGVDNSSKLLTRTTNPKEVISTTDPSGVVGEPGSVYLTNDTVGAVGAPTHAQGTTKGNNLAWYIGDMKPFEKRVLTYRVELKDSYVGIPHGADAIGNDASLYSKQYSRGTEHTNYIPTANATIRKTYATPTFNEELNRWVVNYTLTVRANQNNSFVLTNMKIKDDSGTAYGSGGYADKITLDSSSVALGGEQVASDKLSVSNNRNFNVYIGDLAPGQEKTVTYTMYLNSDEAERIVTGNGDIGIYNTARLFSDDTKKEIELNNASKNLAVDQQVWERKLGGGQVRNDVDVLFADKNHVYNLVGNSLIKDTNVTENGYTIPGGAIRYTILVNEQGNYDVSGTFFKDNMTDASSSDEPVTKFIKYIELKAYDKRLTSSNNGNEERLLNYLNSTTPVGVWYVNIDGMKNFNFTPSELNLPGSRENYAFAMTYYAAFDNDMDNWGVANVSNTFGISGNVGIGDGNYFNINMTTGVVKRYVEPGVEDPFKSAWYYDPTDEAFERYGLHTGAMYWVTEMSGDKIPKGTQFQDSTRFDKNGYGNWGGEGTLPKNLLRADKSHVGFYSANLGKDQYGFPNTIQSLYPTMAEFEAAVEAGVFTEVSRDFYEVRTSTDSGWNKDKNGNRYYDITIEFTNTYGLLNGERLYWVVRTEPSELPRTNSQRTYANKINYYTPKSGWAGEKSWDYQTISDISKGVKKTAGAVYEVTNGIPKQIVQGSDARGIGDLRTDIALDWATGTPEQMFNAGWTSAIKSNGNLKAKLNPSGSFAYEDGMYVTWQVDINSNEMLNGEFTMIDSLPSGLELVYVRPYNTYKILDQPAPSGTQIPSVVRHNQKRWDNYFIGPGITKRAENITPKDLNDSAVGFNPDKGWSFTYNALKPNIEDGWTFHMTASRANKTDGYVWLGDNRVAAFYYTKDNAETGGTDVMMYFPYVSHGEGQHVTYQFVTKVDESYLTLGDYEFDNQVRLYDKNGRLVDDRGAAVTVYGGSVDKNALMDKVIKDGVLTQSVFPYKIVVNEDARDMMPDSDYISLPLVDRMSSNLTLDNTSLKIYKEDKTVSVNPDYVDRVNVTNGTTFYVANPDYKNGGRTGSQWNNYASIYRMGADGTLTKDNNDQVYWSNNGNRKDRELQASLLIVADSATDAKNYFDNSKAKPNDYQHINDQALNYEYQTGVYVTYQLAIDNKDGKITGPINIVNELPSGVELCYVRALRNSGSYSYSMSSADSSLTSSIMNTRISPTGNAAGRFAGWQEHAVFSTLIDDGANWLIAYTTYYTNGNKVGIHVPSLRQQNNDLTFQLVCRVKTTPTVQYSGRTPTKVNFNITNPRYTDKANLVNIHLKPYVSEAPRTLIYYGGMYTDRISDEGQPWYDPSRVGQVVGFIDTRPSTDPTPSDKKIIVSTGAAVDEYGNPVMYNGTQMKEIKFSNLPDETKLSIEYNVTATLSGSTGNSFTNQAFWEGHEENHEGETEERDLQFRVGSSASAVTHGAVHVIKYDNDNEAKRLSGAQFALFRAQYTEPTRGHLEWEPGVPGSVKEQRYLAVYTRNAQGVEREVVVTRDSSGHITKLDDVLFENANKNDYYHKPVYDDDGKLVVYYDDVLAVGVTDANGNLSYGFDEVPETEKIGNRSYQVLYALTDSNAYKINGKHVYRTIESGVETYYLRDGSTYTQYTTPVSNSAYNTVGKSGTIYKPLYNVAVADKLMLDVQGAGEKQIYRLVDASTTKYYYKNGDTAVECTDKITVNDTMYTTRPMNGNSGQMLETVKDANGYTYLYYRANNNKVTVDGKELVMSRSAHLFVKETDGTYTRYTGPEIDPILYTPHFNPLADDPATFRDESIDKYGEDKIHFNKIYAVVEIAAPRGYVTDTTPHFFVVPNSQYSGSGDNYFYHDEWPSSVHVCTKEENGEITYMLNVGNRMENITVTKLFDGTQLAMKPGTYRFAVYGVANDGQLINPITKDVKTLQQQADQSQIAEITYNENDFGYYSWNQKNEDNSVWVHFTNENGKWYSTTHTITNGVETVGEKTHITVDPTKLQSVIYNLLPNRIKSTEFPGLTHGTYYVYELNDAGYPITVVGSEASGTINGFKYTVTVDGNALATDKPEYGKVDFEVGKTKLEFTNASFSITMTKQFIGVAGGKLPTGVVGNYYFAIWPADKIGSNGLPVAGEPALNTQSITWNLSDSEPVKTAVFTGLQKNQTYYIFELDSNGNPLPNGKRANFNGKEFTVEYSGAADNITPNRGTTTPGKQPVIEITNTAMVALPRTGGIGTTRIMTVGAVLMLVGAGGILLRKKQDREESDCP